MPQYQVPQFIDIEDKVFGPLTIKQFLYIAAGGGIDAVIYNIFKGWVLIVLGVPIAVFALMLAFYKPNGIPMPTFVKNMFRFAFTNKLYLWKHREIVGSTLPDIAQAQTKVVYDIQKLSPMSGRTSSRKLEDLAWSISVLENPKK